MQTHQKLDEEFKPGAVRILADPGKPTARVTRERGLSDSTLGNLVNGDRNTRNDGEDQLSTDERSELARLRWENAELAMERDALKHELDLWVEEAMRR